MIESGEGMSDLNYDLDDDVHTFLGILAKSKNKVDKMNKIMGGEGKEFVDSLVFSKNEVLMHELMTNHHHIMNLRSTLLSNQKEIMAKSQL